MDLVIGTQVKTYHSLAIEQEREGSAANQSRTLN
jgi:hypothetical protein